MEIVNQNKFHSFDLGFPHVYKILRLKVTILSQEVAFFTPGCPAPNRQKSLPIMKGL